MGMPITLPLFSPRSIFYIDDIDCWNAAVKGPIMVIVYRKNILGIKNTSSISKKTTYLVAGENMGPSKREKAEKLEVSIISEHEFISLIK